VRKVSRLQVMGDRVSRNRRYLLSRLSDYKKNDKLKALHRLNAVQELLTLKIKLWEI